MLKNFRSAQKKIQLENLKIGIFFLISKKVQAKEKSSSVSAQKLKCPAWLDSARKLFSSGNFSSNSSILANIFGSDFL